MFVLEKYYTQNQIEPHVKEFDTYEEAANAKAEFYADKGYHYAEIREVIDWKARKAAKARVTVA